MKSEKIAPKNKLKFSHLIILISLALLVASLHLTRNNGGVVHLDQQVLLQEDPTESRKNGRCNLFSGKWVYDNVSYPMYKESECPFMEDDFACEKYGRKDFKYQNWRWQPHDCDLPRFNGMTLLEKLRGKKLVYVGDSLNRNQWKSMLCLINSYLPPLSRKHVELTGNMYYFHSIEYNASIEFYWAPLMVESNCDDIEKHRVWPRIPRIKSIEKHGKHWTDADILVFDSFVWWMGRGDIRIVWGALENPDAIQTKVSESEKLLSYEIALRSWSNWMEMHINRNKTKLFYMGPTPYRHGRTRWGTDHWCYNKTDLTHDETWESVTSPDMVHILESTLKKLEQRGVKVGYLNITQLSAYREDAHPSIYRTFWNARTKEEINPTVAADCLHWCLPGVPDVWNQILYTYIMNW